MKIQLAVLSALLALATSSALPSFEQDPLYDDDDFSVVQNFDVATFANPELARDIQEFINLLDMEKIIKIVVSYMDDDQIKIAFQYMYSEEFHVLVRQVEAMKEYQQLVLYLEDAGLDMFGFLQKVHKVFGMEDYVPPKPQLYDASTFVNKGGLKKMVDEVIATLPRDKIKALYYQKMANSPAFRNFMQKIRSEDFKHIINLVYSSPVFREMREKVLAAGLDLAPVKELVEKIIGYDLPDVPIYTAVGSEFPVLGNFAVATFANPELGKDIQEFINLLDMEKIIKIVVSYMDDDQIKIALQYMYSEEFHVLVRQVEAMKEYQQLVLYLEDAGLDMFGFLQKVHKVFGMEDYVPPKPQLYDASTFVNKGGLKKMVDEVIATLPRDKIKALYYQKMANSPAFRNFMQKIRSEDFKHIINLVYSSPVFREMREKVLAAGLDLAPVKELVEKIIGYDLPDVPIYTAVGSEFPVLGNFAVATFANPELGKDIQEFINLLDMEKIIKIVVSYMDDDQIKIALQYMYSEEFHVLVRQVEAMKEYQQLVLYLEDAGLDMFGFLQKVHKVFGMEDYVPPKPQLYDASTFVNKGGLKKMVDEVIATLPRDKIKALYYQKMANSPAFRNFMQKIRSEDFKHIINLVYSSPVFREMREKVLAAGLDLAPVKELVEKIIGYDLPDVPIY